MRSKVTNTKNERKENLANKWLTCKHTTRLIVDKELTNEIWEVCDKCGISRKVKK